ncbi:MAG: DNA polymerase IV [Alphaproteobacteria bacterium]|nr:MAG: DNA polymerase IV [Alphaproteobacteria bacterium]
MSVLVRPESINRLFSTVAGRATIPALQINKNSRFTNASGRNCILSGKVAASNGNLPVACRDCFRRWDGIRLAGVRGCPGCGSVRLVSHPRLFDLSVAHIDCDAFYASIEKRDRAELTGQPVIVGGGKRGVVSTCCYVARTYGVRSAMPMFKALKLCPDAVVIKPRMELYVTEGRAIREMMQRLTPLVEPVSIDEAYLDLSGTDALHGAPPAISLMKLQKQIEAELRLTISVGLASNKFLAKTASEADKPRGFFALSIDEAPEYLRDKSVRVIGGIGPQFEKKLNGDGIRTVGDIQRLDLKTLVKRYGETGLWLHNCSHGRHERKVDPEGERKSVSSETTFNEDISDARLLEDILWRLSERTADRAKESGVEGRVVTLKLKTHDFKSFTRRVSLNEATQLAQVIFRAAKPMLARETLGQRYRLLGVGISELVDAKADAMDLADPKALKRAKAERASDLAREKFGDAAVKTGRGVRSELTRNRKD